MEVKSFIQVAVTLFIYRGRTVDVCLLSLSPLWAVGFRRLFWGEILWASILGAESREGKDLTETACMKKSLTSEGR